MKTETILAITPLFLGSIGLILGLAVILSPNTSDAKWAAGFGLAGTAIAGASGLAQTKNTEEANIQGDRIQIETVQRHSDE